MSFLPPYCVASINMMSMVLPRSSVPSWGSGPCSWGSGHCPCPGPWGSGPSPGPWGQVLVLVLVWGVRSLLPSLIPC